MKTEVMIKTLRQLYEKHKNDTVPTFETNWALLCWDVANRLEELKTVKEETDKRADLLCFICSKYHIPLIEMNSTVDEWLEQLKENK